MRLLIALFGGVRVRYKYLKQAYERGYEDGKKAGRFGAFDDIEEAFWPLSSIETAEG